MKKVYSTLHLVQYIWKFSKYNTLKAIVYLIVSQIFLITTYFLPIKVMLLISNNNISSRLKDLFCNIEDKEIILVLTLFVGITYGMHILLEKQSRIIIFKIINNIIGKLYTSINKKNKFIYTYIESYLKLLSITVVLIVILTFLFYMSPIIGYCVILYILLVYFIFNKFIFFEYAKFFKISSGVGFMFVFVVEVVYSLYIDDKSTHILTLVIVLVLARYIFMRGPYVMNKLIFVHINKKKFINQAGVKI